MRQILAIFTKDARRFWPEILVSLGLLVALVQVYPMQWAEVQWTQPGTINRGIGWFGISGSPSGVFAACLVALVPISWWILIARLIHCEKLVGHTQFWITRPYEWPNLLAAKMLFLAVFLYAPFFAAQCLLLHSGGFHPFSHLPGLLLNLVYLTAFVVLPLAALSALTTGFGRLTLLILGVILFIVLAVIVSDYLPSSTFGSVPDIVSGNLALAILFGGFAAIVLIQYARHRMRLAWFLLAAVAVGLWAIAIFDPDQALMARHYPPAPGPVQFVYASGGVTNETNSKDSLAVSLPMHESGVADGKAVIPVALKVNLEGPGGASWQSSWQGISSQRYLAGASDTNMAFVMPRAVYDRFKPVPVTLRITFAVVQARRDSVRVVPLPAGDFNVAGVGVCKAQSWMGDINDFSGIACRSAMNQPRLTYITAQWTTGRCGDAASESSSQMLGTAWVGELDPALAEFGITPVWDTPVTLSNPWVPYRQGQPLRGRNLCPGSPVIFTQFRETVRTQTDLVIRDFRLPDLSLGDRLMLLAR
jgi:hypothetical protein